MPERMTLPDRGELIEDAFLTPRVVDAGTFEELASRLRSIIDEAADQTSSLHEAQSRIGELSGDVEKSSERVAKALEGLKRGLGQIDERIAQAEQLIERASEQAAAMERAEQRIDEIDQRVERAVASRTQELERRLEAALQRLEHQAAATEARAQEAEQRVESAGDRLAESIADAEVRRDELVRDAEARLRGFGDDLNQRTEQIKRELASSAGPIVTSLNLLCQRAMEFLGHDPRAAASGSGQHAPQAGSLGEMVERAGELAETLERSMHDAESMREQAGLAEGAIREAVVEGTEAADALKERVEAIRRAGEEASRGHAELAAYLEANRADLDLIASLPTPDRLEEVIDKSQALREQIEGLGHAGDAIAELAASARDVKKQVDRLGDKNRRVRKSVDETDARLGEARERVEAQLDQMRAMIGAPSAELGQKVEQAGARLGELIDQATRTSEAAQDAATSCAEHEQRLRDVAETLEPWRAVLLDGPEGALPPGAQEMVDRVRTELGHEIDRASAMVARLRKRIGESDGDTGQSAEGAASTDPRSSPTGSAAPGSGTAGDGSIREPKPNGRATSTPGESD